MLTPPPPQTHLDCRERGHDGRGAEAVGDEREVREVSLDGRVQDLLRAGVAERGAVLVQQVHQLLGDDPKWSFQRQKNVSHVFSLVQ